MKNLIRSNSSIKIPNFDQEESSNLRLKELGIENIPETLSGFVKIKYIYEQVEVVLTANDKTCHSCNKKITSYGFLFRVKILGIWQSEGYFKVNIKTPEERKVFSEVINSFRNQFSHENSFCINCVPSFFKLKTN